MRIFLLLVPNGFAPFQSFEKCPTGHILNSRRLKPHTGQFGGLTPVLARWRMKRAFIKFCMKRPILKDFDSGSTGLETAWAGWAPALMKGCVVALEILRVSLCATFSVQNKK